MSCKKRATQAARTTPTPMAMYIDRFVAVGFSRAAMLIKSSLQLLMFAGTELS